MTLLLTQMAIILLITVTCGWLALKVGQARVIGEIIGGILIGPSVFGRLAPHLSAHLFPSVLLVRLKHFPRLGWFCSYS